MKTTGTFQEIHSAHLPEDMDREKVQAEMNRIVGDVNRALRTLIGNVHHDFQTGASTHQQMNAKVSALSVDENVMQYRVSGSTRYLLARLSTALYGVTLSAI